MNKVRISVKREKYQQDLSTRHFYSANVEGQLGLLGCVVPGPNVHRHIVMKEGPPPQYKMVTRRYLTVKA